MYLVTLFEFVLHKGRDFTWLSQLMSNDIKLLEAVFMALFSGSNII